MKIAHDQPDFGPSLDVAVRTSAGADLAQALENQDNYLLIDANGRASYLLDHVVQTHQLSDWPSGHVRLAVLDGMGGHGHGREAAEAVAAGLIGIPACDTLGELSAHLDALHNDLQRHFMAEPDADHDRRPGTTLTMLELRPGLPALLYHVGDSRLYEILPDVLEPLTVDHVPSTTFAMAGMLDEQEWWRQVHGEHRSHIAQAFILGNAFANPAVLSDPLYELNALNLPPFLYRLGDRRAIELQPEAIYLLATDGFWACNTQFEWVGAWPQLLNGDGQSARQAIDALFDEITYHPPPQLHIDNLTAIALRVRLPS